MHYTADVLWTVSQFKTNSNVLRGSSLNFLTPWASETLHSLISKTSLLFPGFAAKNRWGYFQKNVCNFQKCAWKTVEQINYPAFAYVFSLPGRDWWIDTETQCFFSPAEEENMGKSTLSLPRWLRPKGSLLWLSLICRKRKVHVTALSSVLIKLI